MDNIRQDDSSRYLRQTAIPGWGKEAQSLISSSRVGIAGAGGLGSPAALYLAAAGIGGLVIADSQSVDISNLNRQILYSVDDIGKQKTGQAGQRLKRLNPAVEVAAFQQRITPESVADIYGDCDLILDCLDNLETRHVLNRFCFERAIPLVHAGIREYYGQMMTIIPPRGPCLACLLPEHAEHSPPPVTGPVAGVLGSLQALEALNILGRLKQVNPGTLFIYDFNAMSLDKVAVHSRHDCPVCSGSDRYEADE